VAAHTPERVVVRHQTNLHMRRARDCLGSGNPSRHRTSCADCRGAGGE
jgi:DnaJ-class molecular chaperone